MGSASSKPSDSVPQVWRGSSQTGVSQNLVEALEASNETNISRLQSLELHIQERVTAELRRLREQEAESLRAAQQKLSAEPAADQEQGSEQQRQLGGPSRHEVAKAIQDLRAKLEERKKVRQLPESVESAKNDVVRCLRENDRRPLDCWREVEAFKEEVRKLEKGWVDKVVS
ncbi:hypothetical protein MYCTH_2298129 [Thermothelomyces thermophilus ATCC 42464]|uniref:Altered inheritance of mitochondria protein 13, mitochondrial n=1 Tax=Thermothelomyces thermophilus (strain ATCC 42464 / BCRC 31852 / DSM 1799) TaxID=573729 RepID=G2Q125_THET4|nr:uncharacterized protein MYCTH_2298129 [Thermothelomyces thermophilus ATCC 42464]AEO54924.1 hypothetical protein MYCTH_2298129 [Thermothelomyces thermophilus ATCC 42464]